MGSLSYSTARGAKRTSNPWSAMRLVWSLVRTSFAAACFALATISVVAPAGVADAAMIDVTITVDNAYSFGFGDVNGIAASDLYGSVNNTSACQIFCSSGPEQYTVDSGHHRLARRRDIPGRPGKFFHRWNALEFCERVGGLRHG